MKMKTLLRIVFSVSIFALLVGCVAPKKVAKTPETADLIRRVDQFYTFLLSRQVGNRHNDQDEKFVRFFLDKSNYYDFLDTYLPLVRDRDLMNSTVQRYYVLDVTPAENGESAVIKLRLLSRDAPLLYRKLDVTQRWFKTYGNWYPGKIKGEKLSKWERMTGLYTLPPKKR